MATTAAVTDRPGSAPTLPRWRYVAAVLVFAALAALAFARGFWGFALWPNEVLWLDGVLLGLMLVSVIVFVRPFFPPLFGPIFFHDLVSTARRGRFLIIRCLYVAALTAMLLVLYAEWFGGSGLLGLFTAESLKKNQVTAFNDSFFQAFMAVQYLVIVLITPGITAGAVAEEKDRKTLEHLLATDLRDHEIVFGKLAARLAYLTVVLLTGLPLLSLMQLLGGVDPQLLLAGFTATALTMLSLAGLSILNSVYATRPRTAIALTYVQASTYFAVTTCSLLLWTAGTAPAYVQWACAGNIYVALKNLQAALMAGPGAGGGTLVSHLPKIMLLYAGFHLTLALLCFLASVIGLRLWARWQASGRKRRAYVIALTQPRLPRVSSRRPMLWKELHTEPLIRLGEAAQIIITTAVAMGLLFAGFVLICVVVVGLTVGHMEESMNNTVRLMGTVLACFLVLGAAVRAAGAISGERDRQTMDTLLTTPIDNPTIVFSKWWGSVLGVRKAGYFLLVLWLVGVGTGGLSIAAVPLLFVALFMYLSFAASLGLWFSLRCRTTLRASIWTMVTLLGVTCGHWLLSLFCCGPLGLTTKSAPTRGVPFGGSPAFTERLLAEVQTYTLTPPMTLSALAFSDQQLTQAMHGHDAYGASLEVGTFQQTLFCLVGVLLYGVAALLLLLHTAARFTPITGRLPLPGARPPRAGPGKRLAANSRGWG
jgi:ABC-type transport system involved in multi-copper enzyme maturation permease subunit